jgi:O-antigen/teichoic acid export membrane protein
MSSFNHFRNVVNSKAIQRMGLATVGPIIVAIANFMVTVLILRELSQAKFGLFSFLMVILQFGMGLSNALICAPFSIRANQQEFSVQESRMFFAVNFWLSLTLGFIVFVFMATQETAITAAAAGLFIFLSILRWFMRSYFFAVHRVKNVAVADITYALLTAMIAITLYFTKFDLFHVVLALSGASLVALATGVEFMKQQLLSAKQLSCQGYGEVWRTQSRWSLLGVTTTELTSNAHAWLVTVWAGPAAFAPIAAASLLFRPLMVALTALTQLERPAIAKYLAQRNFAATKATLKQFRTVALLGWLSTALLAIILVSFRPELIFKQNYFDAPILTAVFLTGACLLLVAWRTPESTFLQADSQFRVVAFASIFSGGIAVLLTVLTLMFFSPVYTLFAVLAGQLYLALKLTEIFKQRTHGIIE